ncbi:MAG: hypothetical protein ACJ8ER_11495 [Allosphingosinicella sp.]
MIAAFHLAAGALLALAAPQPAPPSIGDVPFTGHTKADPALIRSVMAEVGYFGGGQALKCSEIKSVEATIMPRRWKPSDPNFQVNLKGTRYERWAVTMCGKVEPFLVSFWTDKKAGKQFIVAHPFPADPPKKP